MADFKINVVVDPSQAVRGTRLVNNAINSTDKAANQLRNTLTRAFNFAAVSAGITQLIRLGDEFTRLNNRVRVATEGAEFSVEVLNRLFAIANKARGPIAQLTFLYQRLSIASGELGASQEEVLSFVNATAQALAAQGGTTAEAAGSLIQLSQALGNAKIQAQEFNSLVDGAFPLVQAAARGIDEAGGSVARLRQLILQGRITNEQFFRGVLSQAESLEQAFGRTTVTISQAFNVLRNNITKYVGEADTAAGVTNTLALSMVTLAENLDIVADVVTFLGSVAIGVVLGNALFAAESAVRALWVAIAANPIGALLTLLASATILLIGFGDRIKLTTDGLATFDDFFRESINAIGELLSSSTAGFDAFGDAVIAALQPVIDFFEPLTDVVRELFADIEFSVGGIIIAFARMADKSINIWLGMMKAIKAIFSTLPDLFISIGTDAINALTRIVEDGINGILMQLNRLAEFLELDQANLIDIPELESLMEVGFSDVGMAARDAFLEGFDSTTIQDTVQSLIDSAEAAAQARAAIPVAEPTVLPGAAPRAVRIGPEVQKEIDNLETMNRLLQLNVRERKVQQTIFVLENKLRRELNPLEREALENQLRLNQVARDRADIMDSILGPQEEMIARQQAMNDLLANGSITAHQYANALIDLRMQQAEFAFEMGDATFEDGFILSIGNMLDSVRNFAGEAGQIFGDLFETTTDGFAQATADAIVFGESFEEAIGDVARRALADLIASLVKLGLQYVINAALASTLGNAAVAAGSAQAGTLAAAWATPAALASLASYGANAAPASAAIIGTVALSQGLAAVPAFADGGTVRGPGGPRSDSIPAMLSNGEFVVNAKSASRFRPMLEQINNPSNFANGGLAASAAQATNASSGDTAPVSQNAPNIVNVLDPELVGDYLSTPEGEDVLVNVITRNNDAIRGALS